MRRSIMALMVACGMLAACSSTGGSRVDDGLKAAIAGAHRSPANVARDSARHPYETLSFFGIRPDMTVVELVPGGGWYTEILAPYLRDGGQLIAAGFDPASATAYNSRNGLRLKQKFDENPAIYGKVKTSIFEPPERLDIAAAGSADLVLTFRNVHNWVAKGDPAVKAVFRQVFDTLKPGGVFGVVDHRLPIGKTQDAKASSGYVHETYVIAMAESAGFKLAARSEVNANPKDTADYPDGVWTLPPNFSQKDRNRATYEAIGESDRFTLKFVKP